MDVFDAVHGPNLIREPFDAEPATWEEGARHSRAAYQADPTVTRLDRVATAHVAFGRTLYRPHTDVCKQAPKVRKSTKTAGAS